jgi:hypothetical protein
MSSEVMFEKQEAGGPVESTKPAMDGWWEGDSTFVMLMDGSDVRALAGAFDRTSRCCSSVISCF